jgi:hypothetical protein
VSLFCRHNRYTADCPICSKDTPLAAPASRGSRPAGARKPRTAVAPQVRGPYAAAGPYTDADTSYEVRLERVPGGLRLAEWAGEQLRRRAPVLDAGDLAGLLEVAAEKGLLGEGDLARIAAGGGDPVSRGRSGELREELRVEALGDGRLRIGRWLYRPGTREWELQEAPPMLPAARYAEALAGMSEAQEA